MSHAKKQKLKQQINIKNPQNIDNEIVIAFPQKKIDVWDGNWREGGIVFTINFADFTARKRFNSYPAFLQQQYDKVLAYLNDRQFDENLSTLDDGAIAWYKLACEE